MPVIVGHARRAKQMTEGDPWVPFQEEEWIVDVFIQEFDGIDGRMGRDGDAKALELVEHKRRYRHIDCSTLAGRSRDPTCCILHFRFCVLHSDR